VVFTSVSRRLYLPPYTHRHISHLRSLRRRSAEFAKRRRDIANLTAPQTHPVTRDQVYLDAEARVLTLPATAMGVHTLDFDGEPLELPNYHEPIPELWIALDTELETEAAPHRERHERERREAEERRKTYKPNSRFAAIIALVAAREANRPEPRDWDDRFVHSPVRQCSECLTLFYTTLRGNAVRYCSNKCACRPHH
jgi:hypothetical protein